MPNERWDEVKRIAADALELPPRERAPFIESACTDGDVRAQVERLVSSCEEAAAEDGFLDAPPAALAASLVADITGRLPSGPTLDLRAELQAGLTGRYIIERELGRGGMATVYLAQDERHHRPVALKVVNPELAAVVGPLLGAERFRHEIKIAARLTHPHILPLYDSGVASGHLFYIMPFIEGETLRERLGRAGPLAIDEAVRVLRDLARALAHAHREGIVHRDIKPENILLNRDGDALVTDFGVAKALAAAAGFGHRNERGALSGIGLVLGTPAYLAPEQARGDPATDHRADLYALGVVAYEMLTGTAPFSGRTTHELVAAHLSESPKPIGAVRADVPPALGALVMRLLEKDAAQRPVDASQVLHVLETGTIRIGSGPDSAAAAVRGPASRRIALGAALIFVAAAVGLIALLRGETTVARTPSIAVLPFANTSGNADDEPFTDGLTDELIAALSRVPALKVAARTSTFALKGTKLSLRTIGDTLGVRTILEGSVRRDGARLKVATQLVDPGDSRVLWSETYDRDLRDIFAVQEQIARDIVTALSVRLTSPEVPARLVEQPTEDLEAYQLYMKGRFFHATRRRDELHRAVDYFAQATQRDPAFARAYAGLADAYAALGVFGYERPHDVFPKARAAAERALALDPNLGEGHSSLGHERFTYEWDWKAAEESFQTAIALDPKYPLTRIVYAALLNSLARSDEALAQLRIMRDIDPLSTPGMMSGRVYISARRPDDAIRVVMETLEVNPQSDLALQVLGHAYLQKGMSDEAITSFRRAAVLSGVRDSAHLAYGYAVTGQRAEALRVVRALIASESRRYLPPFHIALAYAGLGDKDAAFRWLERAYEERASFMDGIYVTPGFDGLRSDPRFASLLARMRLPTGQR